MTRPSPKDGPCRVDPGNFAQVPHRSGRDTLASSGSCHRTKAAASREPSGSSPVAQLAMFNGDDLPPCSTGITPLHNYYEAVRPSPAHRYFGPRGWSRLRLFP